MNDETEPPKRQEMRSRRSCHRQSRCSYQTRPERWLAGRFQSSLNSVFVTRTITEVHYTIQFDGRQRQRFGHDCLSRHGVCRGFDLSIPSANRGRLVIQRSIRLVTFEERAISDETQRPDFRKLETDWPTQTERRVQLGEGIAADRIEDNADNTA